MLTPSRSTGRNRALRVLRFRYRVTAEGEIEHAPVSQVGG